MEVAQIMYGVSMSKDGTTKVVAQRLEGPEAEASATAPIVQAMVASEADAVH
jgi:hypothetical protein